MTGRLLPLLAVAASGFAALAAPYEFYDDFSVADDVGEAVGIDIVRNSHYSHGHGKIVDGNYAILLSGNDHVLATPKLGDFRMETVWTIRTTHAGGPGYGWVVRFRYDRESETGHALELFRDRTTARLALALDGREIAARVDDATDFTRDQTLILDVTDGRCAVKTCGFEVTAELFGGASAGYVSWDAAEGSQQQLYLDSVRLTATDAPACERVAAYSLALDKTQGFAEPVRYDVNLLRYASGEMRLEAELSGTILSRPLDGRIKTGGREWESVLERLDTPYVRVIDENGETFSTCRFWNGEKTLRDAAVDNWLRSRGRDVDAQESWPKRLSRVYYAFPERYSIAAGYRHAIASPWRFAEELAREQVIAQDGSCLYDGAPLLAGNVCIKVASPADKRLVSKIPVDIPSRGAALKHAREQHYFYESETVRFDLSAYFRDADWQADEIAVDARITDVYGDPVKPRLSLRRTGNGLLPGGIRRVTHEAVLGGFLPVGVYKLVANGETTVFEVLPDDPAGPCPPLASKLPKFVSMPNEIKFLEQSAFDPWGDLGGVSHYFSVDNRYPAVGTQLEIWRLLPIYRRLWWCWNWNRNSDNLEMRSDYNKGLIRHANAFGGADERHAWDGRYELGVVSYYNGYQMKLLRQFLKEKGLADKVPTPEPFTYEAFRTLFTTCWREWIDWARPRIDATAQEFADYLLSVNPKVSQATYGPYAFYVSHYKTAYALTYGGYPIVDDRRLRENGSFWLFEEYHHSCDYPLFRPAFFVATYDLHFGDKGRQIFPEIYYSGWSRCMDGAVYMAHPMSKTFLADCHQRRIAYQYTYGTPHFRNGRYGFWTDYGFHARTPENGAMEEFVHAWGNLVKNEPKRALKAPFVIHDFAALRRNGEYLDESCNPRFRSGKDEWKTLSDVCNSAEEDLAYLYEQTVVNGYTTPVVTTFDEIGSLTADHAEFVILPPIVEGTPASVLGDIRALHTRGVNLVACEQVVGLEDIFGVRRAADRSLGYVKGESFAHDLAKARYAADGAEVVLFAAERKGCPLDIPLVVRHVTKTGRTVFVNAPPATVRRAKFRSVYHWGQDSLCEGLKSSLKDAFAFLAEKPTVKSEHGLVSSALTAADDVIVIVSDEPPIYKDRAGYPVSVRFTLRFKGIGRRKVESDTAYSVVEKSADEVMIRVRIERDSACFFRFRRVDACGDDTGSCGGK